MVKVYRQGEQAQGDAPAAAQPRTQTLGSNSEPPTAKQLAMLRAKDYQGQAPSTKREASEIIDRLMNS
jgi:hypothetical protein